MTRGRIAEAFRSAHGPLLVACTVAGDPDYSRSVRIAGLLAASGADMLELVMPFSDPVADGQVIQQAGARALSAGMNTDRLFDLVRDVRNGTEIPLLIMTYANIVLQRGPVRFYQEAARAGADGVVVADVPVEEAGPFCSAALDTGIDLILLVSPTTSEERLEKILGASRGFVYLIAAMGVTGAREGVSADVLAFLRHVRDRSDLPVVPGFGISTPAHVREFVRAGADGVIVGSALVGLIGEYGGRQGKMEEALTQLVRDMKAAMREEAKPETPAGYRP
ncbi:MAG: tryptophan synthase subunit alpha [Methanomicrobiaceae archaeon]|nr:tryptophan synthase subunit alpha [Methanomicrobiaceae archaeon]